MAEPKSTLKMHFDGAQVGAARKLLRMSQAELAEVTGLTTRTITRFERGESVRPETVEAVREALLDRGIEFLNGGEPGVRLRKTKPDR
jgi:transcriptional regulator with XRE-family HTH domain